MCGQGLVAWGPQCCRPQLVVPDMMKEVTPLVKHWRCRNWDCASAAAGMQIAQHQHSRWVQVFVVEGAMRVEDADGETHAVSAGGYYFVEPGQIHTETAVVDAMVLVIQAEDREGMRRADRTG